ncbi:hypothetical protein UlMin_002659 [Ulmus minor]
MIHRKSNRIDCMKLDNGEWIYSRNQIGNLFAACFESVFDSPIQPLPFDLYALVEPIITNEKNMELLRIPSWDEVRSILANKIKPLLNRLIFPTQNAFVPGRSIHDNSVLVQKAIHSMKKKKGALGWMALKIDLEKAYERVFWKFLEAVLTAFGFDPR